MSGPTDPRDWRAELIAAGVLEPTARNDANGNPVFRVVGFPPGKEGSRLKALLEAALRPTDVA